jgi:hypothetical protein
LLQRVVKTSDILKVDYHYKREGVGDSLPLLDALLMLHLPIFLVTTPSNDPAGNLPFKVVIGTFITFLFLLI